MINKVPAAASLCLSKAFDSLSYPILKQKLRNLGFEPSANDLVNSFLENRQQQTIVNCAYSDWLKLEHVVPEGTVLDLLLLKLCVNDVPEILVKSF